jgi:TRAP-type C4-dicarboxylate transport system substrate-binding protein
MMWWLVERVTRRGTDSLGRSGEASTRRDAHGARLAIALLALLGLGAGPCVRPECFVLGHPGGAYWDEISRDLTKALQGGGTKAVTPIAFRDLGGVDNWLDILRHRVDIAVVPNDLFARKVPAFGVLNLRFEIRDLLHAAAVTGSALEKKLRVEAERAGFELLGFAWRGGTFLSKSRCLRGPTDVVGRKIMDGADYHAAVLRSAKASVVVVDDAAIFAAYERGLADSAMLTIEHLDALALGAAKNCLTDPKNAPFMILAEVIVARRDPSGKPSVDARLIAELGALGPRTAAHVTRAGVALVKKYASEKTDITVMGDKDREAWRALAAPLTEEYTKRVEGGADLLEALRAIRDLR